MKTYTEAQRWTALAYGLAGHAVFALSLLVMSWSLYHGLSPGLTHWKGWHAWVWNFLLLAQFAAGHSWLLSDPGRRFMARLVPLGLGRALGTTVFAAAASFQLLLLFGLWSPSEVLWSAPEGWLRQGLTCLYAGSWLLLLKAMTDSGLEIQLGYLGWTSVWMKREPVFKPFARGGLYKHVRQPIYVAFTLILWTAPTWTPDHLFLAVLLTGYCVGAPRLKEKRYRNWYGEAFARYQRRVPFWLPWRFKKGPPPVPGAPACETEVAVIGGGPVGLALACLLGARGVRVLVLEQRTERPQWSQAIGITPPSLEILSRIGLAEELESNGVRIQECVVHGESGYVGRVSFRALKGARKFVLSIPQRVTQQILERAAGRLPSVRVRQGVEVLGIRQTAESVTMQCRDLRDGSEFQETASYAAGCDGHRSRVRELLGIRTRSKAYGCHFVMGDFEDHTGFQDRAQLFFTAEGAVESFPLPDQKRRWIVQTAAPEGEERRGLIPELVRQRTGLVLNPETQINQSAFSPRRLDCEVLHDGRVLLCGDAAHVMSPIGGQGMNVGFADAAMAAEVLHAALRRSAPAEALFNRYSGMRRAVAGKAASRAALGMGIGVWTGKGRALLRDYLFREVVFGGGLDQPVAEWFAMESLPAPGSEMARAGLAV